MIDIRAKKVLTAMSRARNKAFKVTWLKILNQLVENSCNLKFNELYNTHG